MLWKQQPKIVESKIVIKVTLSIGYNAMDFFFYLSLKYKHDAITEIAIIFQFLTKETNYAVVLSSVKKSCM